jgi:hypothetical protein
MSHTEKVVILVGLLEKLEEVLEVLVCSMTFLDGGVQDCCQALVLLHETRARKIVRLLIFRSLHEAGLLQDVSGRSFVHHALQHGPDALHGFHAPRNHLLGSISRP